MIFCWQVASSVAFNIGFAPKKTRRRMRRFMGMGRRKEEESSSKVDTNSFDNSQDNRLHKDCWTERTTQEETNSNNEVVLAARARFLRRRRHRREERTSDVATNCMRFTPKNKVVKVPSVLSSKQQGDNDVEVTRVVRRPPLVI